MSMLTEPNQSLKREDISDELIVVDAKRTPLFTMISKGSSPNDTLFEQPLDEFDDPRITGRPDGKDVESSEVEDPSANRAKAGARVQWFLRAVGVGKIAQQTNPAGIGKGKEYAKGLVKKMVELKRDIELTTIAVRDSASDNGTDGSLTRGLGTWIQNGAQSDQPVPADFRTPSACVISPTAITDLLETDLQTLLQELWNVTGEKLAYKMPCSGALKTQITNFTRLQPQTTASEAYIRRFNANVSEGKIKLVVDMFEGDFGTLEFFPHSFMDPAGASTLKQHGYALLMDLLEYRVMQNPEEEPLPNGGGGKKGQIDAILGLVHKCPKAAGKIVID